MRAAATFALCLAALSAILLAGVLIGIFLYARLLGSRTIEEYI